MALTDGNMLAVSGRLTDAAGLAVVAARYYATGAPPPPPPPPAASTLGVDGITATGARVTGTVNANGTASSWWLEYGTSTAYGSSRRRAAIGGHEQRRRRRGQPDGSRPARSTTRAS